MTMADTTLTILRASSSLLLDEGVQRVRDAKTLAERECANSALLAAITIDRFLSQADAVDRPF